MALDGIAVAAMVAELNAALEGGRINKIAQPEKDELLINIKTKTGANRLLISASPSLPLIFTEVENKKSPMTAPGFCMLLRKHIGSGRLLKVTQPGLERVIYFHIEHYDDLGDLKEKRLVVELMGKHSNIIFIDENDMILDSIRHVSGNVSSVREVLPGRTYFIPQLGGVVDPLTMDFPSFQAALTQKGLDLKTALFKNFMGISPVVAEELCFLSGFDSRISIGDLDADQLFHVFNQFSLFLEDVKNHNFSPRIYYEEDAPFDFAALELKHLQSMTFVPYESIFTLLFDYYQKKNARTRIKQKSVDLRHVINTNLERNVKKYKLQLRQLEDTKDRDKYKQYGELINAYGYELKEGDNSLTALNYYTGEEVTIKLDETLSASENAQKYFAKYNKKKRTFEALEALIKETKSEVDYLQSLSTALDIATGEEDLLQLKEELQNGGYIKKRQGKKKEKYKNEPLHYLSSDGYHIYVGKNNLQNDYLTFSFATGGDWWFHAKEAPGSHVIVKANGEEMPDATFEEAGRLAAYYSSKRGTDKVEIDYSLKKNIKKPAGGKPGFVIYHTNYSLIIDSDISQIKRLEDA
ncbi:NFACT family protein [Lachnospiraceae bacterium OttesenSCG-928-J05]|nr:NFACT family protein [Lachnospiraceae bacterium OttesenSCG-928-J05]